MITFAAFYMDLSQKTMARVHQRVASITVTEPYRFIEMMFASAALFHPNSRKVVLTDQQTLFPFGEGIDIIRFDLDPTQPMLARSMAWLAYINQADSHIVFLDSDILINANLNHIFAQKFAVALTYRDHQAWPINAGINFVHGDRLAQAHTFHQIWLDHFQKIYPHEAVWGGDQDVLRDLLTGIDFTRTDSFLHRQHGIDLLLIPCDQYNFSTLDEHGMTGYYPAQKVLHFKGRRKDNMPRYWKTYLSGRKNDP